MILGIRVLSKNTRFLALFKRWWSRNRVWWQHKTVQHSKVWLKFFWVLFWDQPIPWNHVKHSMCSIKMDSSTVKEKLKVNRSTCLYSAIAIENSISAPSLCNLHYLWRLFSMLPVSSPLSRRPMAFMDATENAFPIARLFLSWNPSIVLRHIMYWNVMWCTLMRCNVRI